ncbi:DUF4011 domain-containing protein [Methylosinus sp. Ce-a6]|uniref:DUF4011 domain-containing protein n=1 Tax=Methylosinus sp. Ce-a6 TaxID=2172005 RepID=UPI00135C6DE8|nr:DUF4011 domain-containing protein [Methylosinus sp. Ce-a6]
MTIHQPTNDIEVAMEKQRLLGIFGNLRDRLLDLTLRNPMLNYKPLSRSRRHLQIVDDSLEDVASRLIKEALVLDVVALPDPGDEPEDERTEEFASHLAYLKATDEDYGKCLKDLADRGEDDEVRVAALDRWLRDKVRGQLELPPRPDRKKLDLAEHARNHRISPEIELGKEGRKTGVGRRRLQTLLLSENLEPRIEAIRNLARLSEQEMGFSTLFLGFGYLEWRQSESSAKILHAPLLLLPVVLETRVEHGRKVYGVRAVSEAPETNVTLIKYVEDEHGRVLPDFETDEETEISVEAYLSLVEKAIENLPGWRVRRFLTLGHFAFGRLAMYQDLDAEKWPVLVDHPLIKSILSGIERTDHRPEQEEGGLPEIPEDYQIDAPEIEAVAPLLVHDADASQHSAIIDVMKDFNLVIEGPPGTGKSQTITNVIANVLARDGGRTVLFLSEKLAALEVVKRRLDIAGLGDFCLELHSEKSSPKEVVESLKARINADGADGQTGDRQLSRNLWETSRREIAAYLDALHAKEHAGDSAFSLFSRAIARAGKFDELPEAVRRAKFPNNLIQDEEGIRDILASLGQYQALATAFRQDFGYAPSQSVWAPLGLTALSGQAVRVVEALTAIRETSRGLIELGAEIEQAGFHDRRWGLSVIARIPDAPDVAGIHAAFDLEPRQVVEAADVAEQSRRLDEDLAASPMHGRIPIEVVEAARRLQGAMREPALRTLPCCEILPRAAAMAERSRRVEERSTALAQIRDVLKIGDDFPFAAQETLVLAPIVAAAVPVADRGWLSRKLPGDEACFEALHRTWKQLREADAAWSRKLPAYRRENAPIHQDVAAAATSLGDAFAPYFPWRWAELQKAKDIAAILGIDPSAEPAANALAELSNHLEAIEDFERGIGESVLGPLWKGMATKFDNVAWSIGARRTISTQLAAHPGGDRVAAGLLASDADTIGRLADLKGVAVVANRLAREDVAHFGEVSIREAARIVVADAVAAETASACDPDGVLETVEFTLAEIVGYGDLLDRRRRTDDALGAVALGGKVRAMLGQAGDIDRVVAAARWIEQIRALGLPEAVSGRLLSPACGQAFADLRTLRTRLIDADGALREGLASFVAGFGGKLPSEPEALVELCDRLLRETGQLRDFLAQAIARRTLVDEGLEVFLASAEEAGVEPERFCHALEHVLTRRRAERANEHENLANARGTALDVRRRTFAEQDRLKILKDRHDARGRLKRRQPLNGNNSGPRRHWTEMALLGNEIRKQQRFTNVRSLLQRAPSSIRALKPCFMMSPLSVAKFLPRDMTFDLVIIDEASQMRPEDALGALLRARQIVVVGDPKQLPPTDFFNRASDDQEGDEEIEDVKDESILEACGKSFRRVRTLKWHYRSRCESLIDFSNREFYEKSLITFPMARPNSFSIDLVHVDGAYEANQNPAEAQWICEEAIGLMRRLADAEDSRFGTIGIVTINTAQRDRITEEFRRLASGDDVVERYIERAEARGEPFFVKNLENVQGDERDFIMISLVYGKEPGRNVVKQNFGPINRSEGHRRLNVLFSRARRRIGLFTSMRSTDVKPTETSSRGVRVLRAYLEYAERRGGAEGAATERDYDSPFEKSVAERLRAKGFTVDVQVGVSKFRIDLAVRHPQEPSVYLAGIECDGAAYHSSKSARDRDRLREEVLRDLKWEILRVWSTDWFADTDGETERLARKIDELAAKPLVVSEEVVFGNEFPSAAKADQGAEEDDVIVGEPEAASETATKLEDAPLQDELPFVVDAGSLTREEVRAALERFRRSVIEVEMPTAEPHRCILREAMIEHFIGGRIDDPAKWFDRIPTYVRQGCDPTQKKAYLERICEIVALMQG